MKTLSTTASPAKSQDDIKRLATATSTVKLVRRDGMFRILLDGAVVNSAISLAGGKLQARHVRREVEAKQQFAGRRSQAVA